MKRNRSLLASAGLLVMIAAPGARADQCEVVGTDIGKWAQKLLTAGSMVIKYCEPCGESPSAPFAVKKVEVRRWSGDKQSWTVAINGQGVDLAYTFVQTGPNTYANVGLATGCKATKVSSFIDDRGSAGAATTELDGSGTPGGFGGGGNPCGGGGGAAPPPQAGAQTWQDIGVKECDRYFKKYLTCIQDHFPAEAKQDVIKAVLQARDGLAQAIATPEGRKAVINACKQMDDATKQAVQPLGCQW